MDKPEIKTCLACEGGVLPLKRAEIKKHLATDCPEWKETIYGKEIARDYQFKDYYETIAFVNAVAELSHRENHHPDLKVTYNHCIVSYSTHAVDALTDNDFICAKFVDGLYTRGQ